MIHQGKIVLDSSLELINNTHHHSSIRFTDAQASPPALENVVATSGDGRSWSAIHQGSTESFQVTLATMGGEIVESRHATLEEVFVSRVGRPDLREQAQVEDGAK